MLLSNSLVTLRACEPGDVDVLYQWENDTSLWGCASTVAPLSRAQLLDYVDHYDGNVFSAGQLRLMVTSTATGTPVGVVDLFDCDPLNRRAAVGILVCRECRGKGYGAQALELVKGYCRSHLGLHQLHCTVAADNEASRALFSDAGFTVSGRLRSWLRRGGRWHDAYLYQAMLAAD